MDTNSHVSQKVDKYLLNALTESVEELKAARSTNHHHPHPHDEGAAEWRRRGEEGCRRGGQEAQRGSENGERECKERALRALRELSVFHSERLTAWRKACGSAGSPAEGSEQQLSSGAEPQSDLLPRSDPFSDALQSVREDIQTILDKLRTITKRLDAEISRSSAGEASHQDTGDPGTSEQHREPEFKVEDGGDPSCTGLFPDRTSQSISSNSDRDDVEESGKEVEIECPVNDKEELASLENDINLKSETRTEDDEGKNETESEWITVGLTGNEEDSQSHGPDACFITALSDAAEVLRCEAADAFSCLMVTGSEELVSRVIRVRVREGANLRFPVTVAVPFRARYRSNHRDVVVKIVDDRRRASYVTPVTAERSYGGQRGTFAEVRVYSLGLFAVVSCLKRENYTVPSRGLSLKLSVDSRISLSYPPGSFAASVMAQVMVQPLDAILLAAVKSRSDAYHSVVSTSPVVYLTHPASQPLRRPLGVTLPCPPNPEKKRNTRARREEMEHNHTSSGRCTPPRDPPDTCRVRIVKSSKEMSSELLVALGHRDKNWNVLENVHVKNQQKGLVSLELTEIFDRLLVVRLLSPLQPCGFASLAEELEESVCSHAVTVVLQRRRDEPHGLLVAALPSRDLGWEQNKLRAQGYGELLETSSEFSMCEGDQLLLRFSGNVTSTGIGSNRRVENIAFHSQRRNHRLVHLTEVDPFGNHSSPHYKGTVVFYKVTRGQLGWRSEEAVPIDTPPPGDPICKLSLTLPKKARHINRPVTAKMKFCEGTDSLSDSLLLWLSGELSEEDVAPLVLSLRLRRSTAQLVKLRAGDNLSTQAYHVLAMWRRGLPAAPHQHKASQLAQCLTKSGRPDLARELLLRQAAGTRQGSLQ